jgi:hypothetical protein
MRQMSRPSFAFAFASAWAHPLLLTTEGNMKPPFQPVEQSWATFAGGWNNNKILRRELLVEIALSSLACHLFRVRGIGDNLTQVALPATHSNSVEQVNDSITSSEPCDGGGDYAVPSHLVFTPSLPYHLQNSSWTPLRPERDLLPFIMCELIW